MPITSKYFDSIRIRSGKKEQEKTPAQPCGWRGCQKEGTHRAPAGPRAPDHYFFFCLEHVRAYNKNFNYFSELSEEEFLKFQKELPTGHRPTWPNSAKLRKTQASSAFSQMRSGSAAYQRKVGNLYNSLSQEGVAAAPRRKLRPLEIKAFTTLELEVCASAEQIKTRYKALVKIHHPDANGGDRSSEERLRAVLQAYNLLKNAGFC